MGKRQDSEPPPKKWTEFGAKYAAELDANPGIVKELMSELQAGVVTFLYSSAEERLNNAIALEEYIESIIQAEAV